MSDFEVLVTEPPALSVNVTGEPAFRVDVGVTEPPTVNVTLTGEVAPVVKVELTPSTPQVVEVRIPGPPGPPGEKGERGEKGVSGSADLSYTHVQNHAASLWEVVHNLGKRPSVSSFDSAGTHFEGDVEHVDANVLRINVGPAPFSGAAYLN